MLYLQNTSREQTVTIPSGGDALTNAWFALVSTIEHRTIVSQAILSAEMRGSYFLINVTLPEGTADGEYEYQLTSGGKTLTSGVARIGARPQTHTEATGGIEFRSGN